MSAMILCENCGQDLPVAEEDERASRIRCPACGVVRGLGLDDVHVQAGAADAWSVSSTPRAPGHAGAPSRATQVDEDDDQPYQVRDDSTPTEPCLNCRNPLPRGSLLCNRCGFHQETGETIQRIHKKVDKEWEAGLSFKSRLAIFLGIQGFALMATLVVAAVDGGLAPLLLSCTVGTFLLAFVAGTYSRVNLTRSKLGMVRLTKTWRFCFVSLGATDIRFRQYAGVAIVRSRRTDILDWVTLFCLAPWGIIPSFVWWHYVIEPDQFDVALTRDHGYPECLLYRGNNEAMARDIADKLRSITSLR